MVLKHKKAEGAYGSFSGGAITRHFALTGSQACAPFIPHSWILCVMGVPSLSIVLSLTNHFISLKICVPVQAPIVSVCLQGHISLMSSTGHSSASSFQESPALTQLSYPQP